VITRNDLSRLELSEEEMRSIGDRVTAMLTDHWANLSESSVGRTATRQELETALREPAPSKPQPIDDVFRQLQEHVFSNIAHVTHPRYFAFVPGPSNFVSAMADALASGFNVFAGTWLEASGPAQIEMTTIDWLRDELGLPDSASGLFVSGGSVANMTGIAAARHAKRADDPNTAVLYCSDQTHVSVDKSFRILGFRPELVRRIKTDENFRIDLGELAEAIDADRAAGLAPFCVVGNAGTTNTGAVDPLHGLREICAERDLWFHIDGAYGGAAVICPQAKAVVSGIELADSVVIDPHKWLFQPYEIGAIFVRDGSLLPRSFSSKAVYMQDAQGAADEVDFADYGLQLTRGFRALKLWMSIKLFGMDAFREAVARGIELAELAEEIVRSHEAFEVVSAASLGCVTFRYAPPGWDSDRMNELNRRIVKRNLDDDYAFVTSTQLGDRTVLRLCTINPRTSDEDLRETIRRLYDLGVQESV
jgi:glutamate/tyrosine decarboxylase-like PLP-dependent enzyme